VTGSYRSFNHYKPVKFNLTYVPEDLPQREIIAHIARYFKKYPDLGLAEPIQFNVADDVGFLYINDELLYDIVPYYTRVHAIGKCTGELPSTC